MNGRRPDVVLLGPVLGLLLALGMLGVATAAPATPGNAARRPPVSNMLAATPPRPQRAGGAAADASPATAPRPAASVAPSNGAGASEAVGSGDTRSPGQGPGFVGAPILAVLGVLAIGLAAAGLTVLYVRVTGGSAGAGGGASPPAPGDGTTR